MLGHPAKTFFKKLYPIYPAAKSMQVCNLNSYCQGSPAESFHIFFRSGLWHPEIASSPQTWVAQNNLGLYLAQRPLPFAGRWALCSIIAFLWNPTQEHSGGLDTHYFIFWSPSENITYVHSSISHNTSHGFTECVNLTYIKEEGGREDFCDQFCALHFYIQISLL